MIQKIKKFIYAHKKFILIGNFSILFFVLILFPYKDVTQKIVLGITESLPINIEYQSSSVGFFPPRLSFEKSRITTSWFDKPIMSDELIIKPSYLALLAFRSGAYIQFRFDRSYLNILIKQLSPSKKRGNPIELKVDSRNLAFHHFDFLSSFFEESKGFFNMILKLQLDLDYISQPRGEFQIQAKNVEFQPYSFKREYVGTIQLPQLKWRTFSGDITATNGKINLKKIHIGQIGDSFYLQSKGFLNIWIRKFSRDIRNYNLETTLRLDNSLKDQFFFLDIFLANIEEKISPTQVEYKFKITGQSSYPPKIQRIKENK